MKLFRKKCVFCNQKIERGEEFFKEVKDPVFVGLKKKVFCSFKCVDNYENKSKDCCKSGGGCCG